MVKRIKIVWDIQAKNSLKHIHDFIKKDSVQNAKKVKKKLLEIAGNLDVFPKKFALEKYLDDNSIRSVIKWSYKIIYKITPGEIHIIDIFDVRQNPGKLKNIIDYDE